MSKPVEIPFATTERVRDSCLCLQAQRTARALARRFDELFRPLGLTSGQFSLLMALNRPAAPAMGEIAAVLAMDRTTLTAALKPLERRGLVATKLDVDDRRSRRLSLTGAGRALLSCALPLWEDAHAALDARIAGSDPDRLRREMQGLC